ncbi:hypothetical protein SUGI_0986800 [Cryptomeria japonica]|uniref:F-box protein SKIP5 isoform X2 n=1 Tax=Cryptomeria japonica TaxID=3369 RepID=UPI002414C7B5|nr:F-box protein SKIP5 isoform X2 [Cryptomeria japonica]GLJ46790.1 hypothetical protein SUGI_0986800 [Cryptomeria japonica]
MEQKKLKMCKMSPINALDDGCLMRILTFLSPLPDRYNAARVCCRWRHLASDPRMWLRVDKSGSALCEPGVFSTIEDAVSAARPGDTILIDAGAVHWAYNIQINKPLCLVGGGSSPDDTVLVCSRGYDSALEFLTTGKIANLTIKAELGSCLLHRNGRLTVESCVLQCEEHPLEHLCCPIVSTAEVLPATPSSALASSINGESCVSVIHTRIEGGAKAVITKGSLSLQQVRVIYTRTALFFWFNVSQKRLTDIDVVPFACKA